MSFRRHVLQIIFLSRMRNPVKLAVICPSLLLLSASQIVLAQTSSQTQSNSAGSAFSSGLAQLPTSGSVAPRSFVPEPNLLPTDVTPLIFSGERRRLGRDLQFAILKKLPERMWFSSNTEVSQRFESNPRFQRRHAVGDYVFRVLPNVTVGYDLYKQSSVYCNYFVIKDVFARQHQLTFPTFQSLAMGFRQDIPIKSRMNLQLDIQARELWQTSHLRQADLIPAINLTGVVNPNLILFASSLLQMRSRNLFQGATRELDPFYSVGALVKRGRWVFTASNTFVTNFRGPTFHHSIPQQSNLTMISDYEIARSVGVIPGLSAFIRAEPVWNWDSHNTPGLSGFDFRLFGGLRLAVNKPAYNTTIEQIRNQIREVESQSQGSPGTPPVAAPSSNASTSPTP